MQFDVKKVKILVTVPTKYVNKVRNAVCFKGAGVIGNYSYCTTSVKSIGTFIPNESANPFLGKNNKMEIVKEKKMEFICDFKNVKTVLIALRKAHPYEEPAIDIVPLIDEQDFFKKGV